MERGRKKQLAEEYKNRKPEMGIISFRCIATGDSFLESCRDTKSCFNRNCFQLNTNTHSNKELLELWDKYGEEGFELSVVQTLKYEDASADHSEELEKMLVQCMESNDSAYRIKK